MSTQNEVKQSAITGFWQVLENSRIVIKYIGEATGFGVICLTLVTVLLIVTQIT